MTADGSIGNLLLEAAHPATLADVIRHLETDPDLDRGRRREQCSAARSLCRALGMDPALVPAQPGELRALLRGVTAGAAGVSPARWSNIRSLTLKALKLAGKGVARTVPCRSCPRLGGASEPPSRSPVWQRPLPVHELLHRPRDFADRSGRHDVFAVSGGL